MVGDFDRFCSKSGDKAFRQMLNLSTQHANGEKLTMTITHSPDGQEEAYLKTKIKKNTLVQ